MTTKPVPIANSETKLRFEPLQHRISRLGNYTKGWSIKPVVDSKLSNLEDAFYPPPSPLLGRIGKPAEKHYFRKPSMAN
jgi:hypothetical protein